MLNLGVTTAKAHFNSAECNEAEEILSLEWKKN